MLELDGQPFSTGRALFQDSRPEGRELDAKIYVRFRPRGLEESFLAALDTGASWSCLAPEIAESLEIDLAAGEKTSIVTRWGPIEGTLLRVTLTVLADEGESLDVDATVFVPTDESYPAGRTFLGYGGLLERIRFALDPQRNQFHFGAG